MCIVCRALTEQCALSVALSGMIHDERTCVYKMGGICPPYGPVLIHNINETITVHVID